MKELDHLSFDGTEIMRELAKRRGVFGKALLPVVFTCVLFDCPENYFERLGSIKYAVSQTPQVFWIIKLQRWEADCIFPGM